MLVAYLADDFLEQVFERDDPLDPAELVDHDGHVPMHRLKLPEHGLERRHVGNEVHRAQDRLQVDVAGAVEVRQQILDVEDTDDVVEGGAINRDPGVVGASDQLEDLRHRR